MFQEVVGDGLLIPVNEVSGAGYLLERRWSDDHYRARSRVQDLARGAPSEEAAYLLARGVTATTDYDEVDVQFPRGPHDFIGRYTYAHEDFYLRRGNALFLQL